MGDNGGDVWSVEAAVWKAVETSIEKPKTRHLDEHARETSKTTWSGRLMLAIRGGEDGMMVVREDI